MSATMFIQRDVDGDRHSYHVCSDHVKAVKDRHGSGGTWSITASTRPCQECEEPAMHPFTAVILVQGEATDRNTADRLTLSLFRSLRQLSQDNGFTLEPGTMTAWPIMAPMDDTCSDLEQSIQYLEDAHYKGDD